jgi:hypothetical protein
LLRRGDHRGFGNPISTRKYNKLWRNWVLEFQKENGRLPTKDEVLDKGLKAIRSDIRVDEMNSRGIRATQTYDKWNTEGNRKFKEQTLARLDEMANTRAAAKALTKSRSALKLASKVAIAIPIVGDVLAVGIFLNDVLLEGRPIGEAVLDNGQDLIPVWGELRAVYSLAKELELFSALGLKVDANSLESLVWGDILDFFGLKDLNDSNSDGVAEAYLGKTKDGSFLHRILHRIDSYRVFLAFTVRSALSDVEWPTL